jgi:hypothetical protein
MSCTVRSVRVCDISEFPSISMLSSNHDIFVCVVVMYSGEYDACGFTLSVYPHRTSLRNMPCHGGNRTYYDLWNTITMLCWLNILTTSQLSIWTYHRHRWLFDAIQEVMSSYPAANNNLRLGDILKIGDWPSLQLSMVSLQACCWRYLHSNCLKQ